MTFLGRVLQHQIRHVFTQQRVQVRDVQPRAAGRARRGGRGCRRGRRERRDGDPARRRARDVGGRLKPRQRAVDARIDGVKDDFRAGFGGNQELAVFDSHHQPGMLKCGNGQKRFRCGPDGIDGSDDDIGNWQ